MVDPSLRSRWHFSFHFYIGTMKDTMFFILLFFFLLLLLLLLSYLFQTVEAISASGIAFLNYPWTFSEKNPLEAELSR